MRYREILDNPLADALDAVDPGEMGPELADLGYCALGVPDAKVRESIRLFGEEVIPACRAS